jgi:hypothetical protein
MSLLFHKKNWVNVIQNGFMSLFLNTYLEKERDRFKNDKTLYYYE